MDCGYRGSEGEYTGVDYCLKGDLVFVCAKQQNKSKLPFGALAELRSSFMFLFYFLDNEVQLDYIYFFIILFAFSATAQCKTSHRQWQITRNTLYCECQLF